MNVLLFPVVFSALRRLAPSVFGHVLVYAGLTVLHRLIPL